MHTGDLLLVYLGSVQLPFLHDRCPVDLPGTVVEEHHLSVQHHQLMKLRPQLQHKVSRVTGHRDKDVQVLTGRWQLQQRW